MHTACYVQIRIKCTHTHTRFDCVTTCDDKMHLRETERILKGGFFCSDTFKEYRTIHYFLCFLFLIKAARGNRIVQVHRSAIKHGITVIRKIKNRATFFEENIFLEIGFQPFAVQIVLPNC